MNKLKVEGDRYSFKCPGCLFTHTVKVPPWTFNGNLKSPTFNPSILVTSGHYTPNHSGSCWCTYNEEPSGFKCQRCHSYVRDGRIEFLNDSTHQLAGKTVDLLDYE